MSPSLFPSWKRSGSRATRWSSRLDPCVQISPRDKSSKAEPVAHRSRPTFIASLYAFRCTVFDSANATGNRGRNPTAHTRKCKKGLGKYSFSRSNALPFPRTLALSGRRFAPSRPPLHCIVTVFIPKIVDCPNHEFDLEIEWQAGESKWELRNNFV
jgi:hypothetical protein